MKIYTRTGDTGETGLFGGPRVSKDHPRIDAYGSVDELNAVLGVARCEQLPEDLDALVATFQHELFDLGAELASPKPKQPSITDAHVSRLEQAIDRLESDLPPLRQFILPGGTRAAAVLHLARTVCRRAERRVITLASVETISPTLIVYLNRLSDLLFVMARTANHRAGEGDVVWKSSV